MQGIYLNSAHSNYLHDHIFHKNMDNWTYLHTEIHTHICTCTYIFQYDVKALHMLIYKRSIFVILLQYWMFWQKEISNCTWWNCIHS